MAQAILHERQDILVLATLGKDDPAGREPGLLETGRVEVEPGERPQDAARCRQSRKQAAMPGDKQRRGGVVAQRGCCRRNLVQGGTVQASVGQPFVNVADTERKRRQRPETHVRHALAQERHDLGFCTGSRQKRKRLICSLYVPL